ncbi:MAG: 1-acyl-sn-glycerol-3-phosphate acyltransferase [Lachnospiraceae bacterium]|nr:1-acyl-sn-glycerol-3-phosphate acyltransferase [Lachnospiraceae bacterium]
MRTFLVILALVLFFLLTLPVYLILLCFRKKHRRATSAIAQKIVRYGFAFVVFFTGTKPIVKGLENIPTDQPVLFVSNHKSFFDIPLAYMTLPNPTGFVSKKEMKKIPFLSWWMGLVNCLFLDRDDMRAGLKTILEGVENIKQGYSMFIAPEGTRTHEREPLAFKEGSLKMAEKTGCKIIPVAILGTDDLLENSFPWIRKVSTVIAYGKPIDPKSLSAEDRKFMGAYCRSVIVEMLHENEHLVKENPFYKKLEQQSAE